MAAALCQCHAGRGLSSLGALDGSYSMPAPDLAQLGSGDRLPRALHSTSSLCGSRFVSFVWGLTVLLNLVELVKP